MSHLYRGRVRRVWVAWWDAVSGGAFYTRWSALLSLVVASTISVPTVGETSPEGYARAVAVATVGWIPLAALVVPAALAERVLRSRAARGAVVLGALLAVAVVRTPVNDAVSVWLWGVGTTGAFGPRTLTNLLTAVAIFSIVGVATSQYAYRRVITDRLTDALGLMRARLRAAEQQVDRTRELLRSTAERLRAERQAMLSGEIDFDTVREYSDLVRAASHDLARLARDLDTAEPLALAAEPVAERPRRLRERLSPTPWLSVALIYGIAAAPFAIATAGPGVWLTGVAGVCLADAAAGVVLRRLPRGRHASLSATVFVALWVLVGALVAGVTFALLPGIGMLGLVGLLAIPAAAVTVSLCTDALRRARAAERRSAKLLARVARYVAVTTARSTDPLRRAASLLHGRVQGRCVILAAHADDHPPTDAELADFRAQTDEALDRVAHADAVDVEPIAGPLGDAIGPVDRMLAAWRQVIAVTTRMSESAAEALRDPSTAEHAADAVNEALVNAVKHSTARTATAEFDITDRGRVRVRVASQGVLPAAVDLTRGLGIAGPDVWISQRGADVVLETLLPAGAAPAPHPAG